MKPFELDKEPKITTGFSIPENYFNHFSEKVMNQLPQIPGNKNKLVSIFAQRKTWIYSAAAVLVLGLSIPVYTHFSNHSNEIDDATIENYIAYHSTISDADLVNLLDEKDLQEIKVDMKIDDQSIENELSTNNNLEQYLTN